MGVPLIVSGGYYNLCWCGPRAEGRDIAAIAGTHFGSILLEPHPLSKSIDSPLYLDIGEVTSILCAMQELYSSRARIIGSRMASSRLLAHPSGKRTRIAHLANVKSLRHCAHKELPDRLPPKEAIRICHVGLGGCEDGGRFLSPAGRLVVVGPLGQDASRTCPSFCACILLELCRKTASADSVWIVTAAS